MWWCQRRLEKMAHKCGLVLEGRLEDCVPFPATRVPHHVAYVDDFIVLSDKLGRTAPMIERVVQACEHSGFPMTSWARQRRRSS